jgi:hypothetical protein
MSIDERTVTLLQTLESQIPPLPPHRSPSELDGFESPPDEPDGPINAELRRLLQGLRAEPIDEWVAVTAMGRLRHLYRQRSRRPEYSDILKTTLRRIVEAFPFLQDSPEFVRDGPERYARVGGVDVRAEHGYSPQHRSRFRDLFH